MMPAGRHAVITGGSSGIGLALAHRLVRQGWGVVLLARGTGRLAQARTALLTDFPGADVDVRAVDVGDAQALTALAQALIAERGAPQLLVTSAGVARPGAFDQLDAAVFDEAMRVNYFGTLHAVRAWLPAMRAAGRGDIVMLASGAALIGVFGYSAYAPSKFAVRGLAEVLRGELVDSGVAVHLCCPPDTDTPQLADENLTKPAETFAIAGRAGVVSADRVAGDILAGVAAGRFLITTGVEMALLGRLHSLIAPWLFASFDRAVRRVRRTR